MLAGQAGMLAEPEAIETLAQRYAARLIIAGSGPVTPEPAPAAIFPGPSDCPAKSAAPDPVYAEVDIASLQFTQPRSIGVEAAGLAAMDWLGIDLDPLFAAQASRTSASMAFNGPLSPAA